MDPLGTDSQVGVGGASAGDPGSVSGVDCSSPVAPPLHARLLTQSQYNNSVADLLQVGGNPARSLGGGVSAKLDEVAVELRATAAATVAAQAAANLAAWSPCVPPAVSDAECGAQLVDKLGKTMFRHPLSAVERAQLQKLFDAGLAQGGFATGATWLLKGLLQSPDFLYQLELPYAGEVAGQVVPLTDYGLASRLSFFVWDSPPDEPLLAEAAAGTLSSGVGIDGQVARLLADPRSERGLKGFYSTWLQLSHFDSLARDDAGLTSEVVDSLETSLLLSATQLYTSPTPNIQELFSGESYYLNDQLRAFYGMAGGSAEYELTQLPGEGRYGVLTHPALMASLARPSTSSPIARGLFLQKHVLCAEIPSPPAGVEIPPLPPLMDGVSTRERLEQHSGSETCRPCHELIDPPGLAFEHFDQVGRYRATDQGQPINTAGELKNETDIAGPFANGVELLSRVATSANARRCFVQRYFTHGLLRDLSNEDACSIFPVADSFVATGDLKQLLADVAKSDAFRLRATEDLGVPTP